jgi:diguanylate cyclase (GGDEF)-like protein
MSDAGAASRPPTGDTRALLEVAGDWYWETDAELRLSLVRPCRGAGARARSPDALARALAQCIGRCEWEIPGQLLRPSSWAQQQRRMAARRPFRRLVVRRTDADGVPAVVQLCGAPMIDAAGVFTGYAGIGRDVTEQFRTEEALRRLQQVDPLTGLLNRDTFDERAQQVLANAYALGGQCALVGIGVDRFEMLNRVYGRRVGDGVIAAVAARLREVIGAPHLLGRRGAGEMVALLIDIEGVEPALALVGAALAAVQPPERVGQLEVSVRASAGVAFFPRDGGDLAELLGAGDAALFRAREPGGGGLALFTPELARRAELRARLEQRLRKADQSRDFRLFYQPLVSLPEGRLVGAEALLRWHDAELGQISPAEFIPIAEESGLIVGVGDWVLRESCRQRQLWRQIGLDLPPIAINVSGVQMRDRGFVERVLATLEEFEVAGDELEIEITETGLMDCSSFSRESLQRLRAAGIKAALDDFGVGYSSLAHLRDLPMHRLKIDRSFTVECMRDARTLTIVKAVIDMAHNLGLTVTAEGIETQEQRAWMQQLGCDSAQGFLFAQPMAAEEFLQQFLDGRVQDARAAAPAP